MNSEQTPVAPSKGRPAHQTFQAANKMSELLTMRRQGDTANLDLSGAEAWFVQKHSCVPVVRMISIFGWISGGSASFYHCTAGTKRAATSYIDKLDQKETKHLAAFWSLCLFLFIEAVITFHLLVTGWLQRAVNTHFIQRLRPLPCRHTIVYLWFQSLFC